MNTKTEKPKFLGTKTEKTDLKNSQNQKYQMNVPLNEPWSKMAGFPFLRLLYFSREDTTFL